MLISKIFSTKMNQPGFQPFGQHVDEKMYPNPEMLAYQLSLVMHQQKMINEFIASHDSLGCN